MIVETEGVVLKQVKTVNGRKMLTIFTKKYGKVSVGTNLTEGGKNKTALSIRPFTYANYEFFKSIIKENKKIIEENINALYFAEYIILEANLNQDTIEKICSYDFKLIADCVSTAKASKLANVLDKLLLLKADTIEILSLSGEKTLNDGIKTLVSRGLKRGLVALGKDGAMCFEKQDDGIHTWTISNMPGYVSM